MFRFSTALALAASIASVGCAARGPSDAWPGARCTTRLPSTDVSAADLPLLSMPTSRVMIGVEVQTEPLLAELERAVPRRVSERRGEDLGAPGKLSFAIDRGPFGVHLEGDALSVDVDLHGHAEVCKPLGLLGCVDYASCDPGAHARAAMTLLLTPDLRLPSADVSIPITRRCTLTALSIDVTSEVEAQADARAKEIQRRIDASVPDVAPIARDLWNALGQSVPLGAGTCARVLPTGLVQSGPRQEGTAVTLGLGVEGEVRIESPCAPAERSPPMPPPRVDRDARPGVRLEVPLVSSWEEIGRGVARSLSSIEVRAGDEIVHVTDARVLPAASDRVTVALTIAGNFCGEIDLRATPSFDEAASAFVLADLQVEDAEAARVASIAPRLDLRQLASSLAPHLRAPASIDVRSIPKRIDAAAALLLAATAGHGPHDPEVSVAMRSAHVASTLAAREGLAAVIVAEGSATVRVR